MILLINKHQFSLVQFHTINSRHLQSQSSCRSRNLEYVFVMVTPCSGNNKQHAKQVFKSLSISSITLFFLTLRCLTRDCRCISMLVSGMKWHMLICVRSVQSMTALFLHDILQCHSVSFNSGLYINHFGWITRGLCGLRDVNQSAGVCMAFMISKQVSLIEGGCHDSSCLLWF